MKADDGSAKAERICYEVLGREPAERDRYITEACRGDHELIAEVTSLIRSYEAEEIPSEITERLLTSATLMAPPEGEAGELAGRRAGAYVLLKEIGRGGMGEVYLAARADDQFHKQVAIKLVRRGVSPSFISRFRMERQILASLDHPNIASLLDGGTTEDGIPYFVLEYVDGQPIDEYCEANNLSVRQRLELFRTVCSAVHYAHTNLVIHRDIKPSNILVTADGVPKLLDFGIAKLLSPGTSPFADLTQTGTRLMTPAYASPEQVKGETVTTASDIYSLGVVLYELLTGRKPYRITSRVPHEILRIICEQEPDRPSTVVGRAVTDPLKDAATDPGATGKSPSRTAPMEVEKLRRRLAGDIDNIVLMAMRKEPERRYASVNQFSNDIKRHLDGLPVLARKDTFSYRAAKFIQRNRNAVIAAVLIVATLIAGVVATAWQAVEANRQRARAERRFNEVRNLANSLMFDLHDEIEQLPGSTAVRAKLVKSALEYLDSLAQEAGDDASLQRELAIAYQKVGDVQSREGEASLGDTAGARDSYRKALVIREALYAANPAGAEEMADLATSYMRIGDIHSALGELNEAMRSYEKALAIRQKLADAAPDDITLIFNVGVSLFDIANLQTDLGDVEGGLATRLKMLPIFERAAAADPNNPRYRRAVALSNKTIGGALARLGQFDRALEHYQKALAMDEELAAADPMNVQARVDVTFSLSDIGYCYWRKGQPALALEYYRKVLVMREGLLKADPQNQHARGNLATTYSRIGAILVEEGSWDEAIENHRKALAIREADAAADPLNARRRGLVNESYRNLGSAYETMATSPSTPPAQRANRWQEARSWYVRCRDSLLEMQSRGQLAGELATLLDEMKENIERCDRALSAASRRKF